MPKSTRLADYSDPVAKLFTLGEDGFAGEENWADYPALYGFDETTIPELIRLACDRSIGHDGVDDPSWWAPAHAVRALGKLRAASCIEPLLDHLKAITDDEDDDLVGDLSVLAGMIGPAAIPPLATALADHRRRPHIRMLVAESLGQVGIRYPEARAHCVSLLRGTLAPAAETDRETAAMAVCMLIDLGAVETIDLIRDAMAAHRIEESICGDIEDVEIALELRAERATPAPVYHQFRNDDRRIAEPRAFPRQEFLAALASEKIGRNDPCPCGSGKKYKKCCLT